MFEKATLAPWKKILTGSGREYSWTIQSSGGDIADVRSLIHPTKEEREEVDANAELVLRAQYIPQMLEMMKRMVSEWEGFYEEARTMMPQAPHRPTDSPPYFMEEIKALIEKVEKG